MTLHAFTDGASRGNPGEAVSGVVVTDEKSDTIITFYGYIGVCTNNVAEYTAMETLLERARSLVTGRAESHIGRSILPRAGSAAAQGIRSGSASPKN